MTTTFLLIKRNVKLFFKDKGMFFTSLITPAILLVLYVTFLGNVYRDGFETGLGDGISLPKKVIDGLVGGQLISSLLAVSCVTVAFCSNFLMVQDRANGSIRDFKISPVKGSVLAVGYYVSSLLSTLIVCLCATALCLLYVASVGWYMSAKDVMLLIVDVIMLVLFGTALSSVINFFLSTQGQISAVGTIISAGYGFICGAYMPISSFGDAMQKAVAFLPGTYGTALMRTHCMRGALDEMQNCGVPGAVMDSVRDSLDCNIYFFDKSVSMPSMYLILLLAVVVLVAVYVVLNSIKKVR